MNTSSVLQEMVETAVQQKYPNLSKEQIQTGLVGLHTHPEVVLASQQYIQTLFETALKLTKPKDEEQVQFPYVFFCNGR